MHLRYWGLKTLIQRKVRGGVVKGSADKMQLSCWLVLELRVAALQMLLPNGVALLQSVRPVLLTSCGGSGCLRVESVRKDMDWTAWNGSPVVPAVVCWRISLVNPDGCHLPGPRCLQLSNACLVD